MIINSFFTKNGLPALGLTPIIKIWMVEGPTRTVVVDNQAMTEDAGGYYWYNFVDHQEPKDYVLLVDAGEDMIPYGRYNTAAISPKATAVVDSATVQQIVSGVWDEQATNHTATGTMGALANQTHANTEAAVVAIASINGLIQTLLKYERNRTKIDPAAKTLTVYDDDGVTPIRVFDLKDSAGAASVAEVAERMPRP